VVFLTISKNSALWPRDRALLAVEVKPELRQPVPVDLVAAAAGAVLGVDERVGELRLVERARVVADALALALPACTEGRESCACRKLEFVSEQQKPPNRLRPLLLG